MARYDLGLQEVEFWRLTPRQFDALRKRYVEAQKREDYRAGVLAATMANAQRDPKKRHKPYGPADFFPSLKEPVRPAAVPEETGGVPRWQVLLQKAEALNFMLGGRDLRGQKQQDQTSS